jgi:hypothetical protein
VDLFLDVGWHVLVGGHDLHDLYSIRIKGRREPEKRFSCSPHKNLASIFSAVQVHRERERDHNMSFNDDDRLLVAPIKSINKTHMVITWASIYVVQEIKYRAASYRQNKIETDEN